MTSFLTENEVIIERDVEGKLIPEEWILKTIKKEKVLIKPIPRGTIKKYFGAEGKDIKDLDGEILIEYCVKPVFTKENVTYAKPYLVTAIVNAILDLSGLTERKRNSTEPNIEKVDETLKKKFTTSDIKN